MKKRSESVRMQLAQALHAAIGEIGPGVMAKLPAFERLMRIDGE